MSSFGAVVVADTPADSLGGLGSDGVKIHELGSWCRQVAELDVDADEAADVVAACPVGTRAAIAEDFDEYGARFRVVRVSEHGLDTLYEAYVLNADPADQEQVEDAICDLDEDPRPREKTGAAAARAAALLFEVDPSAMTAADNSWGESAWKEIGITGGPFPWWGALKLPWPNE